MKHNKKTAIRIIIIALVAILVLLAGGALAFSLIVKKEAAKMKPLNTQQILPNVYVVRDDFVNMYLIKDEDKYIAIDAGISEDAVKKSWMFLVFTQTMLCPSY